MGGKAGACRVYPDQLCEVIVVGLKRQLTIDGDKADKRGVLS